MRTCQTSQISLLSLVSAQSFTCLLQTKMARYVLKFLLLIGRQQYDGLLKGCLYNRRIDETELTDIERMGQNSRECNAHRSAAQHPQAGAWDVETWHCISCGVHGTPFVPLSIRQCRTRYPEIQSQKGSIARPYPALLKVIRIYFSPPMWLGLHLFYFINLSFSSRSSVKAPLSSLAT